MDLGRGISTADCVTAAAARSHEMHADLAAMIAIDSQNPPGREAAVAAFLAERVRSLGGDVRTVDVAPSRPNVIGSFSFGAGPTLLLTSHTDTVPIGAASRDLLAPAVDQGRLYGRGACDAKGSLVAMLSACAIVADLAGRTGASSGRIVFAAVVDEEAGGTGTKHIAATEPRADWAIVGEPTDLRPTIGHKGSMRKRVTFVGRSAHSSDPDAGVNAIYRAARFVLEVERWNERLRSRSHPLYGRAVVSANVIRGGAKVNTIADRCAVEIDRRLLPDETDAMALAEMEAILAGLPGTDPQLADDVEDVGQGKPPASLDPAHPLAATLQASAADVLGRPAPFAGFRAGADMGVLLAAGIPTAMFGPGSLDHAHSADEHVVLADVQDAAAVYADVALRLLALGA